MADRGMTAGMDTAMTAAVKHPILLAKFIFDSGDLNLWSGIGDITFAGDVYTGTGDLGGVSSVEETEQTKAAGVVFSISGIKSSFISTALGEDYQGRTAKLWLGAVDDAGALIADPELIFVGRMDVMTIDEGGETATLKISVENVLIALESTSERRYTPEDQKLDFPNDTGFDQVAALQDVTITWGAGIA